MEIPDIHVRVLFDFDYTTKDGKNVKIKEGEKLYLIKKTNEDWWQVIRNSGRPFYVPASYIEEIPRSKGERKFSEEICKSENQIIESNYRMRSCSVDSEQVHEGRKIKPVIPKRTIFYTNRVCNTLNGESPNSLKNGEDIKNDEEVDYVNIDKQNIERDSKSSSKTHFHPVDNASLSTENNVDRLLENISNNLMTAGEILTNGYSHVSVRTCNLSPGSNSLDINLSHSLEELTQEIELKAKSIGGVKSNTGYSKIDFVKSLSKDIIVPAKNISDAWCSDLKQVNAFQKCNDNEGKNKLQYSGSFKTKHEREKWAKNYVLSSMREEEYTADVDSEKINENFTIKGANDDNNNVNVSRSNVDLTENFNVTADSGSDVSKSDNSDIVKSDKSVGYDTKMSLSNEKVNFVISSSSISKSNDFAQKSYFDSSNEDLDKNMVFVSTALTASDKGSTDSLLDVDTHLSILDTLDGSICTTASDSILHTSDTSEECLSNIIREEPSVEEHQKRKLTRNRRVECHRIRFPIREVSPPVPEENQQPSRELFGGWCEYTFTDGRIFFYNSKTREKSWKPPRRRCNADDGSTKHSESIGNLYSGNSSPLPEVDDNSGDNLNEKENFGFIVPVGWRLEIDPENGCQCFINIATGAKWFSSKDDEGRVYYFEEHSNESSWTLPATVSTSFDENVDERVQLLSNNHIYSNIPIITRSSITSENSVNVPENYRNRSMKAKSLIIMDTKNEEPSGPFASKNWPQLLDGHMSVLKEGSLNRTKITENGKRLRKNWSSSHVVLTELLLLFFKDAKSFVAGISGPGRPEISIDLNGAVIDKGDKVSSRKNVYRVSTMLGTQVLIQNDCSQQAHSWQMAIQSVINNLPLRFDSCPRFNRVVVGEDNVSQENESKKLYKVTRSKSIKAKSKDGSIEDLAVSPAERQTKIKARLKKFFHRRPTMEALVKKGIWKDEPAFGCYLDKVAGSETPRVPLFVRRCVNCIEKNEENMKTDGLYRASGNLSQVQKIRLQVDQNNLSVIEEEEDVHVLTGALKLFFRELKEPLIPYHLFNKAIKASHNHNKKEKISQFREITKALPTANYDTLKFLLQHLLKVTKYKDYNRMHIPNIAIVFGPTLMWPEQESNNMALDLMQQNLVIECLLVEYDNIFR